MGREGLRPHRFFTNADRTWNNFDFWVVVVCLPWSDIIGGGDTGVVRILRLARLMRLMKLVKKVGAYIYIYIYVYIYIYNMYYKCR